MENKEEIEYILNQNIGNLSINKIYKIIDKEKIKYKLTKHNIKNIMYIIRPKFKNIKIINKIPDEYLKNSEMLIKVLNSKQKNIKCHNLTDTVYIDYNGDCFGCCPGWVKSKFGNIENRDLYNTYRTKIIRLSSMNKTYCFCDLNKCKYGNNKELIKEQTKIDKRTYPKEVTIAHDKTCNLRCSSCRKTYYKNESKKLHRITDDILSSNWMEKSTILLAGQGEVFYSKEYQKI